MEKYKLISKPIAKLTPKQLAHLRKNNKGFRHMEAATLASIRSSKKAGEILPPHRS